MTARSFAAAVLVLGLCSGCNSALRSDYSQLDLVNAHGTVTLDGQPLAGAVITFEAPDGQFSFAQTNSSGQYKLQLDSEHGGVTPGEKTVRISTTRKILGLNTEEGEEAEGGGGEGPDGQPLKSDGGERVPDKYNKNSELKVTVSADKTQYDFDLKSN